MSHSVAGSSVRAVGRRLRWTSSSTWTSPEWSREDGGSYSVFYNLATLDHVPQHQDYTGTMTQGYEYQAMRISKYKSSSPNTQRNCRNQRQRKSQKQPKGKNGSQKILGWCFQCTNWKWLQPLRMKVKPFFSRKKNEWLSINEILNKVKTEGPKAKEDLRWKIRCRKNMKNKGRDTYVVNLNICSLYKNNNVFMNF